MELLLRIDGMSLTFFSLFCYSSIELNLRKARERRKEAKEETEKERKKVKKKKKKNRRKERKEERGGEI